MTTRAPPAARGRWRHPQGIVVVVSIAWAPSLAAAQGTTDGAYGRLDGDLSLSLEAGVSEAFSGEAITARAGGQYLASAGWYLGYHDALGSEVPLVARSLAAGIEIAPLFLGRFASDLERGPALLDLWLDSLALGLGAFHQWHTPRRCGGAAPDASSPPSVACTATGLELSLGMALPLLARASGPYLSLRGAIRLPLGPTGSGLDLPPSHGLLALALGYRQQFAVHLVDAGNRLPPR